MKTITTWEQVEKLISPFIKNYWVEKEEDNPVKVTSLQQAVTVSGDSFYGVDEFIEFSTTNNHIGVVRRTIKQGVGTAYRNKNKNFTIELNVNNKLIFADILDAHKILSID